jgi:multiple antibiotic resistance protein
MKFDVNFLLTLLSIINPLGTIPIFISLTKNQTENRLFIASKSALYSTIIMATFYYFGPHILGFFSISLNGLQLAGGIVVAISGYAMIESKIEKHKGIKKRSLDLLNDQEDPSLIPIAMPMLAGPGSIAFLIGENMKIEQSFQSFFNTLLCILISGAIVFITLACSNFITKHLKENGIKALSRFVGFFIMAIGAEMVIGVLKKIFPYSS